MPFDQMSTPAPTATGGALADGTYELVKLSYYGPTGSRPTWTVAASFYLQSGRYEWESTEDDGDFSAAGKIMLSGNKMYWASNDCGHPFTFAYSVTPQGFKLYQTPAQGVTVEYVMAKK